MNNELIARAKTVISAPIEKVWQALVDPAIIKEYMFGSDVESSWTKGSDIFWRGEWKGQKYEDRGKILAITPGVMLKYSHYSPMSGLPDLPENHSIVTIHLTRRGGGTLIELLQLGSKTEDQLQHSEKNWRMMLDEMKKLLEV